MRTEFPKFFFFVVGVGTKMVNNSFFRSSYMESRTKNFPNIAASFTGKKSYILIDLVYFWEKKQVVGYFSTKVNNANKYRNVSAKVNKANKLPSHIWSNSSSRHCSKPCGSQSEKRFPLFLLFLVLPIERYCLYRGGLPSLK